MPLYEYQCEACGERFEAIRKFSDPPLEVCEKCGKGPVQRLVSSPAFQFKGSGWYITDYAKKDSGSQKDGSATGASTSKTDTPSSDKGASATTESAKSDTSSKPATASGSKETTGGSKD